MAQKSRFSAGVASGDYTLDNFQQAYGDVEERKVRESLLASCFCFASGAFWLCVLIPGSFRPAGDR
jgi:hypothetical protein